VTDSFDLGPGLVIVTVCGGISVSNTNGVTDAGPEANVGGVVEARAGGAEARVSEAGAEARAGGAVARSGSGSTTSRQETFSFSKQTRNQVDTNCVIRTNTNQRNTNIVDTNQRDINQEDIIHLLDANGAQVAGNLANETGSPEGSQAVQTKAGRHALDVQVDGPWTIKLEQPRTSSAPQTTRFSGNKTATNLFKLSRGPKRFEMTHRGNGKFTVHLLDKNGAKVGGSLANAKGLFKGSKLVRVPRDDVYLLQVEANGPWSIRVR
jgi:hypothetical protein